MWKIVYFWKISFQFEVDPVDSTNREGEMRKQFAAGYDFPPLMIRLSTADALRQKSDQFDAVLTVTADEHEFEFAAEFKSRNSPRLFEDAILRIENRPQSQDMRPMLVVPFLHESQLQELQRRKLSGIDLSGNGVVIIPGKLLVYRCGIPNKFPDSAPTKYAYRGATSLVGRTFLCRGSFQSLAEIEKEIGARGGKVVLSTISKALKRMESDLIVDRTENGMRLRQPDKLLDQLAESYRDPKVTKSITLAIGKSPLNTTADTAIPARPVPPESSPLARLLAERTCQDSIVFTGRSSIENYAVMGRQEWPVLYTSNIDRIMHDWRDNVQETSRFIDVELRETDDPTVYFDTRTKEILPYASPIQVYLECCTGDKREREIALQVKNLILRELRN